MLWDCHSCGKKGHCSIFSQLTFEQAKEGDSWQVSCIVMTSLGNALVTSIKSHTDAEKKFRYGINCLFSSLRHVLLKLLDTYESSFWRSNRYRPWWDQLEDFLLYGLVMIGLITFPNSFVLGKNLECTVCLEDNFCFNLTFTVIRVTLILKV